MKWIGGKTWAVKKFGSLALDYLEHSGGVYLEPFLGGAAMALYVGANYEKQMILGDVVEPLIEFYEELQKDAGQLAYSVAQIALEYGTDEKGYYAVREIEPDTAHLRAARFVYLNRLGFNGLYRENKSGQNNVPAGSRAKKGTGASALPERRTYVEAGLALARASIDVVDFEAVIDHAEKGDFLYIDPPYFDTFANYSKGGFGVTEHERLALALYRASERGVIFLAHNSLDDLDPAAEVGTRYWYDWASIIPIEEPRRVAANGDRKPAPCALITNSAELAAAMKG